MPCQPKVGHVSFLGPLDHTQMRAGTFRPSQLSGSERDSHIVPMSFGKHPSELWFLTPFSCTLRLDPHAAFPDTRARSLNIYSVSKNVPDRNLVRLRFHANTGQRGFSRYKNVIFTRSFTSFRRLLSAHPLPVPITCSVKSWRKAGFGAVFFVVIHGCMRSRFFSPTLDFFYKACFAIPASS